MSDRHDGPVYRKLLAEQKAGKKLPDYKEAPEGADPDEFWAMVDQLAGSGMPRPNAIRYSRLCFLDAGDEAEARRLSDLQRAERGTVQHPTAKKDGKPLTIPGSYIPTPERENRAAKIISLRRRAGRAEHPLRGEAA